ncbi:MAG: STAS domain-containing protein [Ilumatobacteraceae bacterium]
MDLFCRRTVVGDVAVVMVSGELDLASVGVLRDALLKAITEHRGATVAVDLDGVTALDDTALGIVLGSAARSREQGGDLVVVCTSPRLVERFELSGLARAVRVLDRLTP